MEAKICGPLTQCGQAAPFLFQGRALDVLQVGVSLLKYESPLAQPPNTRSLGLLPWHSHADNDAMAFSSLSPVVVALAVHLHAASLQGPGGEDDSSFKKPNSL